LNILVLNTSDAGGGAERVAYDVHKGYLAAGHRSLLLVGKKYPKSHAATVEMDPYPSSTPLGAGCRIIERMLVALPRFRGQGRLRDYCRRTGVFARWRDWWNGIEDFNYSCSHDLLNIGGWRPDVIHAHNLHGNYFDLRALAPLSRIVPVVWTLHDCWAFTGHCSYPLRCERWLTGCGQCPDLKRFPPVRRDRTHANWDRKRTIYARSRLAVGTPSQWLGGLLRKSMIAPWATRVIPNGIDLAVFRPGNKASARERLGLPANKRIILYVSAGGKTDSTYKDYRTVQRAIDILLGSNDTADTLFLYFGSKGRASDTDRCRGIGYVSDTEDLVRYYQAADLLLHAAHGETFGLCIQESLACGTPVVATAVGGIPEQIVPGETGFLTPEDDAAEMAKAALTILRNPRLAQEMSHRGIERAHSKFSLTGHVAAYLSWFEEILAERAQKPDAAPVASAPAASGTMCVGEPTTFSVPIIEQPG
jgi:glycosyltransferase involved in cell wall biosynthesis